MVNSWLQRILPNAADFVFLALGLLLGILLLVALKRFRFAVWPQSKSLAGPDESGDAQVGHTGGIEVFKSWDEAYPIISSARVSIKIVDSFLVNEAGGVRNCIEKALTQPGVDKLAISIFIASTKKVFGAQRIREKEGEDTQQARTRQQFKQYLNQAISKHDRERHDGRFRSSLGEISDISKLRGAEVEIRVYPTMPTIRVFVIDDVDFVFGWFPLLAGNPGYPCCHFREGVACGAENALAKSLRNQVKIIESISDVWTGAR
jgi:hypothetical protein